MVMFLTHVRWFIINSLIILFLRYSIICFTFIGVTVHSNYNFQLNNYNSYTVFVPFIPVEQD